MSFVQKYRVPLLFAIIILVIIAIVYLDQGEVTPPTEILPTTQGEFPLAPELVGISGYLNTNGEEIKIEDYRGQVVLIDFWTYSCINCIRTLPYLTDWDEKYRDDGLVTIGVHTPEFGFEEKYDNVADAIVKHGIEYAVVQDNDYETWRAYENRFWPRKYLIDKDGFIRYDHIGEGAYEETENVIRELLEEINGEVTGDMSKIEDQTPTTANTPELYAGYGFALPRGQNVGNDGGLRSEQTYDYKLPETLQSDVIYLEGEWSSKVDFVQSQDTELSTMHLTFTAKKANVVLDPLDELVELDVYINDNYVTHETAGDDVQFDGKRAYVLVENPDLYNVYNGDYGEYDLRLQTSSQSLAINAFTFG